MAQASFQTQVREFYPDYILAHSDRNNKILHFIGATSTIVLTALGLIKGILWLLPIAFFIGYLLPGIGHKHFQKNDSFRASKPILCVACAFIMYLQLWSGKLKF